MAEPTISKRIHISGLTPSISADDLTRRLGIFGKVTALDGLGALNAVGLPRPFGYATLESTPSKLNRCLTLLSGSTWKGAKLRIGEAKPDYHKRIALENNAPEPPSKRRRLTRGVQGVHAKDMSLVTPETAAARANWHVFPSGRTIRTVRIRPTHPLPPKIDALAKPTKRKGANSLGKKTRAKEPPTRARRRTIDMMQWGSTQIKGVYLDSGLASTIQAIDPQEAPESDELETTSDDADETGSHESVDSVDESDDDEPTISMPVTSATIDMPMEVPMASAKIVSPQHQDVINGSSFAAEKSQTLNFLNSLFGDQEEWGDRETIDEGITASGSTHMPSLGAVDMTDTIEEVPRTGSPRKNDISELDTRQPSPLTSQAATREHEATQPIKLKDLFAPREDEGGFSLLGHLDLDVELEDDPFMTVPVHEPSLVRPVVPVAVEAPASVGRITLDPQATLFFPLRDTHRGKRKRDPFSVARESGRHWRDCFFCTEDEEAIRARWDSAKLELTRDWKKRHREAAKSRRRRGMGEHE